MQKHPRMSPMTQMSPALPNLCNLRNLRIVLQKGVGPVPVTIQLEAGRPTAAQLTAARLPSAGAPPPSPAQSPTRPR
jgi:hypothetical protein